MKDAGFVAVRRLFDRLAELDPDDRGELLDRECDDPSVRVEVEAMLRAHEAGPSFLDGTATELAGPALETIEEATGGQGRRLGAWVLEELIGRGGTSVVYRAHRADSDVEQRVAVKLLRIAFVGGQEESFLREQQILARLRHPNIATLIEGGVAEDGTPYFVMELVEGRTIDDCCREEELPLQERVRLFRTVCNAVSYAHRRLVIHRDLKPANILVDDAGQVRLLDFGIAKLLEERDATMTARMLTPAYAAPEQFAGTALTTATDVFGLGVVLYELVAGRRPPGIESRTPSEPEGVHPPPSPSRLAEHTSLDRDLDRVVRKAIHPDPFRRYEDAQSLTDDLGRWLDRRPVQAAPDSLSYRASLFVRRNRLGVGAAALAAAGMLVGGGAALWQAGVAKQESLRALASARLAEQEARRADRVRDFLVETFAAADPYATSGEQVTAKEILEAGVARIEGELRESPDDRLRLLVVLGTISRKLGDFERSEELLAKVLASDGILSPKERVEVRAVLGEVASNLAQKEVAEERFRQALELAKAEGLDREGLEVTVTLASHFVDHHQAQRARELLEPILSSSTALATGLEPTRVLATMTLAEALQQLGQYDAAASWGRRAVAALERSDPGSLGLASAQAILAGVETALGDLETALELERSALATRARAYGEKHPRTLVSKNNLSTLLKNEGRFDESASILEEVLAAQREALGGDHPHLAATLFNLGEAQLLGSRVEEALQSYSRAVEIQEAHAGPGDPQLGIFVAIHGRALARAGRFGEARERFQRGVEILESRLGTEHPMTARVLVEHADFLNERGEFAAAAERLAEAAPILSSAYGDDSRYLALALLQKGRALVGLGRREEARESLESGLAILTESPYRSQYGREIELARSLGSKLLG